ncbi:cation:proton antiporter [Patescibacteria group bacterium]
MHVEELFFEIGIIIVFAAAVSLIIYRLRQPLIIAYILAGIIVGPGIFALLTSTDTFEVMSTIGLAFLLFTVGLGLNWRSVKEVGAISLATGIGQVIFTTIIGFLIGQALGLSMIVSLYLAAAFTFSSTIVVVKLLSDTEELDTLHGRIAVGFLLVQDFIAMFILLGLDAFSTEATVSQVLVSNMLKGIILVPALWVVSAKIVPKVVSYAAKSRELLFVFSIAWCFFIAGILVAAGFGVEIGALIAGVTLSGTIYQREISMSVRPLRDFFLIIFFIVIGTRLDFDVFYSSLGAILTYSGFVLFGNPLIVMLIMRALGYHPRTGFLSGTSIAQISEFSFIVLGTGIALGHIGEEYISMATAIGLITIAGSSYLIKYNEWIYDRFKGVFRLIEPKRRHKDLRVKPIPHPKVVIFGFHRLGEGLMETITNMKVSHIMVDLDPVVIRELHEAGEAAIYGDAGDPNFLAEIQVEKAKMIISTIPEMGVSYSLLHYLKQRHYTGTVVVAARTKYGAKRAYQEGANYVIVPQVLTGERFDEFLRLNMLKKSEWKALGKLAKEKLPS